MKTMRITMMKRTNEISTYTAISAADVVCKSMSDAAI